jgi:hypothetical protein
VTVNLFGDCGDLHRVLRRRLDQLDAALNIWTTPDARPRPEVTQAGQDARSAIDGLLRGLHELRIQLVDEFAGHGDVAVVSPDAPFRTDPAVGSWRDTGSGPGWAHDRAADYAHDHGCAG